MDPDKASSNESKPIEADDFARYAKALELNETCERCKNEQWGIYEKPGFHGGSWGIIVAPGVLDMRRYFPVLIMACSKCGNLWSMSRTHVLGWLKENPCGNA